MRENQNFVLITGASKGIGKDLAFIFAKNGFHLILVARDNNKLKEIKKILENEYNINVEILPEDLSNQNSPKNIWDKIYKNKWNVQILINNTGFATSGFFLNNSLYEELDEIQVNISSLIALTHYIGNEMLKDSLEKPKFFYKILNVASTAGFQPGPFMSSYYATKAFVLHFSEG